MNKSGMFIKILYIKINYCVSSSGVMSCSQGISTPACLQYPWQQRASQIPVQWIGWLQVSQFRSMQCKLTRPRREMWSPAEQRVTRTAGLGFRLYTIAYLGRTCNLNSNNFFRILYPVMLQWRVPSRSLIEYHQVRRDGLNRLTSRLGGLRPMPTVLTSASSPTWHHLQLISMRRSKLLEMVSWRFSFYALNDNLR